MAKIYVCDFCGTELGETACSNSHGGSYCSKRCSIRAEVLDEPVATTVDSSQASPAVIEMFTALSRKIVSLERQLADTQRNVERQAEELENAKHRISKHAEKVEMLTDDVITLDERSQVLNAINKYYAEGSR